jgi:hypothetical protein
MRREPRFIPIEKAGAHKAHQRLSHPFRLQAKHQGAVFHRWKPAIVLAGNA